MKRDLTAEKEMIQICSEVWDKIGIGKMPKIESKYGGSTGAYYVNEGIIRFRSTSWNKMPLAGKRMIAIHELYHALGREHDSKLMFCHAFDILTLVLYKLIYGEDYEYNHTMYHMEKVARDIMDSCKKYKV